MGGGGGSHDHQTVAPSTMRRMVPLPRRRATEEDQMAYCPTVTLASENSSPLGLLS